MALSSIPLALAFTPGARVLGSRSTARAEGGSGDFTRTVALTPSGAAKAMAAAEAEAAANGWKVTIVVADASGTPMMLHRNAFPASCDIAMGKAKSAVLFGKATAGLEAAANVANGTGRSALLSSPFVLMRGGVPIVVDGQVIGSIGVSGVAAQDDEKVALAGAASLMS